MFAEDPSEPIASAEACAKMQSRGVECWAGAGINNEERVDIAIARGVTLITCNNPDEILDILRKKGKHE